jgi:hypothetical protein
MNYNQNDPVFKNTKLGFSNKYTLFSDGCYVFCLAYILGIDVIECNEKLKNAGAFMANSEGDVCLLNHTKIASAFPNRIASVAKYDSYDNDAALEAIEKNGKVIVKVDFDGTNSTTMDTHFVTFIGNKTLFDSLGGKEKPTSTYPILRGLRVITLKDELPNEVYKGYTLSDIPVESLKVMIDKITEIQEGKWVTTEEHQRIINELDSKSTEAAQTYAKDKQILEEKIRVQDEALLNLQTTEHTWQDTADKLQRQFKIVIDFLADNDIQITSESTEDEIKSALSSATRSEEIANLYATIQTRLILSDTTPEAVLGALDDLEKEYNNKIASLKKKTGEILSLELFKYIIKIYGK